MVGPEEKSGVTTVIIYYQGTMNISTVSMTILSVAFSCTFYHRDGTNDQKADVTGRLQWFKKNSVFNFNPV